MIIGAGVSGLACAQHLRGRGLSVKIFEARSRVGGRAYTVRKYPFSLPLELGAEFIHGTPPEILERLEAIGQTFVDTSDTHLWRKPSGLEPSNEFWEKVEAVMSHAKGEDQSFQNFLDSQKSKLDSQTRKILLSYIEGFHAADSTQIGMHGLAEAEKDGGDLNGTQNFRPVGGYQSFVESLTEGLKGNITFNAVVKKISWSKDHCQVTYVSPLSPRPLILTARFCVVTLPIGVLKTTGPAKIEFAPYPRELEKALSGLESGHAQRINFLFKSRFWEKHLDQPIGYLHAGPDWNFPTWWSQLPLRNPLLVAWQGGPKAQAMGAWSEMERVNEALKTLAYLLDMKEFKIRDHLVSWRTHNWAKDPYSLGAYSYVNVGGAESAKRLAQPFEEFLFFAGEATNNGGRRGTVDGAINTGLRAAEQILSFLK